MCLQSLRITLSAGAVLALAALLPNVSVAQSNERAPDSAREVVTQKPAVVAQAPAPAAGEPREANSIDVVAQEEVRPVARRGIRWGILEGADAARVYNARKHAIYNSSSWERIPGK
jgi:hypothetical protein